MNKGLLMAGALFVGAMGSLGGSAFAQDVEEFNKQSYFKGTPLIEAPLIKGDTVKDALSKLSIKIEPVKPNTFSAPISADIKMKIAQTMLLLNPLSMRQMINFMAAKKQAIEGLSFDDVIDSMKSRATSLNFRLVSHNTPWKLIEKITGKKQPRLEILTFCDLKVMRAIVDHVPEFVVFLPCRITVMEDANGKIWLVTIDWDVRWLDASLNPTRMSPQLRKDAIRVREMIESVMAAGANGDL